MNATFLRVLGITGSRRAGMRVDPSRYRTSTPSGPQQRSAQRERDKSLAPEAIIWLRKLPNHRRPHALVAAFPRICNHLALVWPEKDLTENYFNSLLLDKRPGRKGFPANVASDLVDLHEFYCRTIGSTEVVSAWDDRMLAVSDR